MFGKYQAVFQSRWKALMWAAGVCLTAYCSVPAADQGDQPQKVAQPPAHINPWAKDYHPPETAAAPQKDAIHQLSDAVYAAEHPAAAKPKHVNPWAKKPEQQH